MLDAQQFPLGTNHLGTNYLGGMNHSSRAASYASRPVWFAATDADQLLLQTIDHLLEAGDYSSFSDLCKQALRAWLLPDEPQPDPTLILLQQQMVALQLQVNQLSQQISQLPSETPSAIAAQLTALLERVAQLEQGQRLPQDCITQGSVFQDYAVRESAALEETLAPSVPAVPVRESDPLLDRLVALLEDF